MNREAWTLLRGQFIGLVIGMPFGAAVALVAIVFVVHAHVICGVVP